MKVSAGVILLIVAFLGVSAYLFFGDESAKAQRYVTTGTGWASDAYWVTTKVDCGSPAHPSHAKLPGGYDWKNKSCDQTLTEYRWAAAVLSPVGVPFVLIGCGVAIGICLIVMAMFASSGGGLVGSLRPSVFGRPTLTIWRR